MLIDAHIHMFSEKIAQKALTNLSNICKSPYFTNGTLTDTKEKLQDWGVDAAIAMNIATKPSQQTIVNNWAASIDLSLIHICFISERAKILPRRVTGTCARHQRQLTVAIKRARHLALLPFSSD